MVQNSSGMNTLYVCPVYWGCSVHWGDTMSTSGDIMSTLGGYHEYNGGCSVHQGSQYKLKGFCPPHAL